MKRIIRYSLALLLIIFMFILGNVAASPRVLTDLIAMIQDLCLKISDRVKNMIDLINLYFF